MRCTALFAFALIILFTCMMIDLSFTIDAFKGNEIPIISNCQNVTFTLEIPLCTHVTTDDEVCISQNEICYVKWITLKKYQSFQFPGVMLAIILFVCILLVIINMIKYEHIPVRNNQHYSRI